MKNKTINLYLQQEDLIITYNHYVVYKWITANFWKKPTRKLNVPRTVPKIKTSEIKQSNQPERNKQYLLIEEIMKDISVNFCIEICNVVLNVIKLKGGCASSIGFKKFKLILDQVQESRGLYFFSSFKYLMFCWSIVGSKYESYLANLLLRDRHWQTELLIESLWWSFKELSQHSNISKVSYFVCYWSFL